MFICMCRCKCTHTTENMEVKGQLPMSVLTFPFVYDRNSCLLLCVPGELVCGLPVSTSVSTSRLLAGVLELQMCALLHPPKMLSSGALNSGPHICMVLLMEPLFQLQVIFSCLKKANIIKKVTTVMVR